jgi:hypothetical protein
MHKPAEAINHLDTISLGELWRGIARVRVSALISVAGVLLTYTVLIHDIGVRRQMSETAVSTGHPFDMTLTLSERGDEHVALKGIYFRVPEDYPSQKGKISLKVLEMTDEGLPKPIGVAQVEADEQPNMMWSRFVADGIFSLVASAHAAEPFNWAGHQQRRDFYERISTGQTVRRYYSDGWVLEYRVDDRGFAIPQTLAWVNRR